MRKKLKLESALSNITLFQEKILTIYLKIMEYTYIGDIILPIGHKQKKSLTSFSVQMPLFRQLISHFINSSWQIFPVNPFLQVQTNVSFI